MEDLKIRRGRCGATIRGADGAEWYPFSHYDNERLYVSRSFLLYKQCQRRTKRVLELPKKCVQPEVMKGHQIIVRSDVPPTLRYGTVRAFGDVWILLNPEVRPVSSPWKRCLSVAKEAQG